MVCARYRTSIFASGYHWNGSIQSQSALLVREHPFAWTYQWLNSSTGMQSCDSDEWTGSNVQLKLVAPSGMRKIIVPFEFLSLNDLKWTSTNNAKDLISILLVNPEMCGIFNNFIIETNGNDHNYSLLILQRSVEFENLKEWKNLFFIHSFEKSYEYQYQNIKSAHTYLRSDMSGLTQNVFSSRRLLQHVGCFAYLAKWRRYAKKLFGTFKSSSSRFK